VSLAWTIPPPIPLLLVGLLIAWVWTVWWTVRRLTRPPRRTYGWAVSRGVPGDPGELRTPRVFTSFSFRGHRGVLRHAWDVIGNSRSGPIVVLTHGWGESRVTMLDRADRLLEFSSRVVMWDLPGHGESQGHSGLGAFEHRDLRALLDTVCPVGGPVDGPRVVLYGFSLGAGVSLAAAVDIGDPVVGVVLEAPYRVAHTPARAVLRGLGLPAGVTLDAALAWIGARTGVGPWWNGFDRASLAAKVRGRVQVLVLHGEHDGISPPADGKAIAHECDAEFVEIAGASHLDLWEGTWSDTTRGAVAAFLSSLKRV